MYRRCYGLLGDFGDGRTRLLDRFLSAIGVGAVRAQCIAPCGVLVDGNASQCLQHQHRQDPKLGLR